MDYQKTDPEITEFIQKVKKNFHPEKIILFGSRARGDAWKNSDYDFIIISRRFSGIHWLDRISKIVRFWSLLTDIDVLPYTPEEFEIKKNNSSTLRTALKEGKLIAQ